MADDQEFPPEVVEAVRREMCASCQGGGVCEAPPCDCARDILRTLTALGYRRVGPGEVVVPHDPTEEMIDAGRDETVGCCNPTGREARILFQAMLAAAPSREGGA